MTKRKLMFVDDDLDMIALYEHAAATTDTMIAVQTGGLSALKLLNSFHYNIDAIVIDLSLPDIDGITLTQQIRTNESLRSISPIPIFWWTCYPYDEKSTNDSIVSAARRLNVIDVFKKPEDVIEIVKKVHARLDFLSE